MTTAQTLNWQVGQQAVISRQTIVTIERVTPAGRVIAGGRTFDANGKERTGGDPYRRARLEPLTPEIQAGMDLVVRGQKAGAAADAAFTSADRWLRRALSTWDRRIPEAADVEKAERLIAAIQSVMEGETGG